MRVLIRVDAYPGVGLGHFTRCLAIARELETSLDTEVFFAGNYSDETIQVLKKNKIDFLHSSEEVDPIFSRKATEFFDPDVLFIDNLFNYSCEQLQPFREKYRLILMHNLCQGRFCCDDFILPSAHHPVKIINDINWKKNKVNLYHGFDYIPLNPEAITWKEKTREGKNAFRVGITTGGSDPLGVMNLILPWIANSEFPGTEFIALPGRSFIHRKALSKMTAGFPESIKVRDFDYRWLSSSDLVISTFGVTSYELIYLQKPVISLSHAPENARGSSILSEKLENFSDLGMANECSPEQFLSILNDAIRAWKNSSGNERVYSLSPDGKGTQRIAGIIRGTHKITSDEK